MFLRRDRTLYIWLFLMLVFGGHFVFTSYYGQDQALVSKGTCPDKAFNKSIILTVKNIQPSNLTNYVKDLQLFYKKVRDHQRSYGAVDSWSQSYKWRDMDTDKLNFTGGELLVISSMQKIAEKCQTKLQEVKKNLNSVNGLKINQLDGVLAKHLQQFWIRGPSELPYNMLRPEKRDHSMGQSLVVDHILSGKRGGFFIECGALDGETRSNSLFFERFRDWTGLLIEPDPVNYQQALQRNRKAYLVPSCISGNDYAQEMNFKLARSGGMLGTGGTPVQCFPVFSLLKALNQTRVDYFSLDVEGAELKVLKTIPFDKIDIQVLTVEFSHTHEGKNTLLEFMISKGYSAVHEVKHPAGIANDIVFVKTKPL